MGKKQDRWQELCKLVEAPDGLPTREAGPWTEDKLWFWNRYVDITTSSMVGHPRWTEGLVYVDLFAGPGICHIRDTGRRFPGSPLIAARAPKPFRSILLCELDVSCAQSLETRLANTDAADRCQVFRGDCNACIPKIVAAVPDDCLTLAFVDPEGLHVWFETIQALSGRGRVDLLILFADSMDIVRNVDTYYAQKYSNLDRVLGPRSKWRELWPELPNQSRQNTCRLFADEYERQLKSLGYLKFGEKEMRCAKGPLYRLIFASKHERGLEFWDKITLRDRSGQTLFGPG